jgi:hypothetical protein
MARKRMNITGAMRDLRRQIDDKLVLSRRALEDGAEELVGDIKARTPVDTGALRDSVRTEDAGRAVRIVVGGVDDPRVGRVDYGSYVGMEEVVASVTADARPRLARRIQTEIRR